MEKQKIRFIIVGVLAVIAITGTIACILKVLKKEGKNEILAVSMEEAEDADTDILQVITEEDENSNSEILEESEDEAKKEIAKEEIKENKVDSKNTYYVKVNNSANVVTIYTKDANGEYTVPVKVMVCSTGVATPKSGKFKTPGGKGRWGTLFGHTPGTYVYGQYTTKIVGNILFHSVPYLRKNDPASLEYLEYDKLGTSASAGCVRLTVQDAQWIFNNISSGTIVEFYSDSNPGPLGKPGAAKISGNIECRDWDPTDSNPSNPWKNQTNNVKVQSQEVSVPNNIVQNSIKIEENSNNVQNNNNSKSNTEINNNKDIDSEDSKNVIKEEKNIISEDKKENIIIKNDVEEDKIVNNKTENIITNKTKNEVIENNSGH